MLKYSILYDTLYRGNLGIQSVVYFIKIQRNKWWHSYSLLNDRHSAERTYYKFISIQNVEGICILILVNITLFILQYYQSVTMFEYEFNNELILGQINYVKKNK